MSTCEACGTNLPTQTTGRPRKFCRPVNGVHECRDLNSAIERLEKALGPVTARLVDGDATDRMNLVELRYRLFCLLGDEVPRARYPLGHPKAGQFMKRRS
ncbi:MAG: hypothetical protein V3S01_02830 [Dehalococcoidia bacterium]